MSDNSTHPLSLILDPTALEPLITAVIERTLARLEDGREQLSDKLAYSEAEAARLLSLNEHQLRDERRRARIQASVGPGKKILYTRSDLLAYLMGRRWKDNGQK